MFSQFGEAKSMAPPFIFGVANALAGVPVMFVAPPSGGKTTIIFAIEDFLNNCRVPTRRASRLNLRGLKVLGKWINSYRYGVILNEDYSAIGSSEYMVEKMAEIVGFLSYSHTFQDDGLGVDITCESLGFISGIQPLWLKDMISTTAFATHIREKFIRYYLLPYTPTKGVETKKAIPILSNTLKLERGKEDFIPHSSWMEALTLQVGKDRAREYTQRLLPQLSKIVPHDKVSRMLRFFAPRLRLEQEIVEREIVEDYYKVSVDWMGYTALFWCLRRGDLTRQDLAICLQVTSGRSVDRITEKGIAKGFITSYWNDGVRHFRPTDSMKEMVRW